MIKRFFLLFAVLSSIQMYAQSEFDQKLEQLFFNVNVANNSLTLLDSLSAVDSLHYIKVDASADFYIPGTVVVTGKYLYEFKRLNFIATPFDKGIITLLQYASGQNIAEIFWELQFTDKDAANQAFDEIVKHLKTSTSTEKIYTTHEFPKVAEISDSRSTRYGQVLLRILNNKNPEKKYRIRLFLEE